MTLIVQLLLAASELPQLLVWLKSPLATMEPMESGSRAGVGQLDCLGSAGRARGLFREGQSLLVERCRTSGAIKT